MDKELELTVLASVLISNTIFQLLVFYACFSCCNTLNSFGFNALRQQHDQVRYNGHQGG